MPRREGLLGKTQRRPPMHSAVAFGVHCGRDKLAGKSAFVHCGATGIALQELHLLDTCLAAASKLDQRLHYFQCMKVVRLDPAAVDRNGFFDDGVSWEFN